jgi:hypothetical protein
LSYQLLLRSRNGIASAAMAAVNPIGRDGFARCHDDHDPVVALRPEVFVLSSSLQDMPGAIRSIDPLGRQDAHGRS